LLETFVDAGILRTQQSVAHCVQVQAPTLFSAAWAGLMLSSFFQPSYAGQTHPGEEKKAPTANVEPTQHYFACSLVFDMTPIIPRY
jgi:hypothetical protein